ncbi:MAG: hypothetical protein WD061_00185 [Candidatus Saccharimonadales bacterium]
MITGVTRKAVFDLFRTFDRDPYGVSALMTLSAPSKPGIDWWGNLEEVEFLKRLYDLKNLPSSDSRYEDAEGDIRQHRYANDDWEDDWIFTDERFQLQSSDKALLKFLTETLHPEVRSNKDEVNQIRAKLNELLKPDCYEIKQADVISGRPVFKAVSIEARKITPLMLREGIGQAIRNGMSAYEVANYCDSLKLPKPETNLEPMASKAGYVKERIKSLDRTALIKLARTVLEDHQHNPLVDLINEIDMRTTSRLKGRPKNLIFAANGPKPEIFLSDSVNNDIKINKNAKFCLIYDAEIDPNQGISWDDLVLWWMAKQKITDKTEANRRLYKRLLESCNEAEKIIFNSYGFIIKDRGFELPALIPQVYLHFDPLTASQRDGPGPLVRQRMDFLMLLPGRNRVVIELDGKQHYADANGKANPALYSTMMKEDRKLRLSGYHVFRFGGSEFTDKAKSKETMSDFFKCIFDYYGMK